MDKLSTEYKLKLQLEVDKKNHEIQLINSVEANGDSMRINNDINRINTVM